MLVLRNDVRALGGLQFAGLADYWSPEFGAQHGDVTAGRARRSGAEPLRGRERRRERCSATPRADAPTVVLSHNPDVQDLPIWDGVRGWVLAGHTHGGQVKPPFLPPPILPVSNKRYTAGAFDVGPGRTMYVNRGLGFFFQVRFNVRPELTLFTLTRAPTAVVLVPGSAAHSSETRQIQIATMHTISPLLMTDETPDADKARIRREARTPGARRLSARPSWASCSS